MEKICRNCKLSKPEAEFYKDKRRSDGLMSYCKQCQQAKSKASLAKRFKTKEEFNAYMREREQRQVGTHAWLRRKCKALKLSETEIARVIAHYEEHEGHCEICGVKGEKSGRKSLFVDHCHKTMTFRGLICQHCNTMLGQAKDDPSVLRAGIAYLEKSL